MLVDRETGASRMTNPARGGVVGEITVEEVDINKAEVVSVRETVIGELSTHN